MKQFDLLTLTKFLKIRQRNNMIENIEEKIMKIYHVETQQAYDELMNELEEKGHRWLTGVKPTEHNYWEEYKKDSCVIIPSKYITFNNIEQSKKQHPNIPVIEYKAKGE